MRKQAERSETSSDAGNHAGVVRLPLLAGRASGLIARSRARVPTEKLLQVGELARASGKTVRAIHHYEELGLLRPDARSKGRFRLYDPSAITRVRWIGKLHDLGMSLGQIQKIIESWGTAATPGQAMSEVRATYRAKLDETRSQIAHLAELEKELVASIDYLDTCDSCDPSAVLDAAPVVAEHDGVNSRPTVDGSTTARPSVEGNDAACGACQLREREAEPDLVAGIVA